MYFSSCWKEEDLGGKNPASRREWTQDALWRLEQNLSFNHKMIQEI